MYGAAGHFVDHRHRRFASEKKQMKEALSIFSIVYTQQYSTLNLPHNDCNKFRTALLDVT